jgi:uncharacterized protein YndB with AHSA1/START domain
MSTQDTDRIEKQIVIKAPRSRVWRAISDARQFGEWFQETCRASSSGPASRCTRR